jgi:hypothetical protein
MAEAVIGSTTTLIGGISEAKEMMDTPDNTITGGRNAAT